MGEVDGLQGLTTTGSGNVALTAGSGGAGGSGGNGGDLSTLGSSGGAGGNGGAAGSIFVDEKITSVAAVALQAGSGGNGGNGGLGGRIRNSGQAGAGNAGGQIVSKAAISAGLTAGGVASLTAGNGGNGGNGAGDTNGGSAGAGGIISTAAGGTMNANEVRLTAGNGGAGGAPSTFGSGGQGGAGGAVSIAASAAITAVQSAVLAAGNGGQGGAGVGGGAGGTGGAGGAATVGSAVTAAQSSLSIAGGNGGGGGASPFGSNGGNGGAVIINAAVAAPAGAVELIAGKGGVKNSTSPFAADGVDAVVSGSRIDVTAGGSLSVSGDIRSTSHVVLTAGENLGDVLTVGSINSGSNNITLQGHTLALPGTSLLTGNTVAIKGVAGINAAGGVINTVASNLRLENTGSGDINVINTGDVTIAAANNGGISVATANGVAGVNSGRSGNLTVGDVAGLNGVVSLGGAEINLGTGRGSGFGASRSRSGSLIVNSTLSGDGTVILYTGVGNYPAGPGNNGDAVINHAITAGNRLVIDLWDGSSLYAGAGGGLLAQVTGSAMDFTALGEIYISGIIKTSATQNASLNAGNGINSIAGQFLPVVLTATGPGQLTLVSGGSNVYVNATDTKVVVGSAGITASTANIRTTGQLVLNGAVSASDAGDAIVLAGSTFTNNAGANALVTTNTAAGTRWQVYSTSPAGNTFGGLLSGNTAVWGTAFNAASPTVSATGNRFIFSDKQGAAITADDVLKTYGQTAALTGFTATAQYQGSNFGNAFTDGAALTGITVDAGGLTSAGAAAGATRTGGDTVANPGSNTYDINVDTTKVSGASNYNVTAVKGMLSIDHANLTIAANDVTRTYDGTSAGNNAGVSYTGLVAGDTGSSLGGTLAYGNAGAVNAGSYSIGVSGQSSANYAITYTSGNLTIDRRQVIISGMSAADRQYDGTTTATLSGGSINNLVDGETLSFNGQTGTFGSANAGTHAVTVTGTTLGNGNGNGTGAASNYILTDQPTVANATINQRQVSIGGITAADRQYDGTNVATLSGGSINNLVAGETLSFNGQTGKFASANAGTHAVTVTGTTLGNGTGAASNYILTNQPTVANATINQRQVTISGMTAGDRVYNGTTAATLNGGSINNLVEGETLSFNGQTGKFASANAGTQAVTVTGTSLVSGSGQASNYTLTNQPTVANATIARAQLGLTGQDATRVEGQIDPFFQYIVASGQLFGSDTLSGAAGRAPGEAVGFYGLNVGTLANPNYTVTLNGGQFNITAAPVNTSVRTPEERDILPAPPPLELAEDNKS